MEPTHAWHGYVLAFPGVTALGSWHVVDEMPGCRHIPWDAEPHCHRCPGAPTPPLPATAPALPSPICPLPGTKWHVWAWGCWDPTGDAVVRDPKKPLMQDLKTFAGSKDCISGAILVWEQVRGPANPSQGALHQNWGCPGVARHLLIPSTSPSFWVL